MISFNRFFGDDFSIAQGVIVGLAFGILMEIVLRVYRKVPKIDLPEDESVLLKSGASHKRGNIYFPGTLYLTEKRLLFLPFEVKKQVFKPFELPFSEIESIHDLVLSLLFSPGFQINTKNEKYIVFALVNPWKWKKRLNLMKKDSSSNKI